MKALIIPLLAVKIFGYLKKQKRPQKDLNISILNESPHYDNPLPFWQLMEFAPKKTE
jgi:hypothetical protein